MGQAIPGEGPASVVLIHAWRELGPASRIQLEFRSADGSVEGAFATTVDEAVETVRRWLERAVADG